MRFAHSRQIVADMAGRSRHPSKPLTRCGDCGGTLVYPVAVRTGNEGRAVITRRCPECQVVDIVTCEAVAAILWLRREAQIRTDLQACLNAGP